VGRVSRQRRAAMAGIDVACMDCTEEMTERMRLSAPKTSACPATFPPSSLPQNTGAEDRGQEN